MTPLAIVRPSRIGQVIVCREHGRQTIERKLPTEKDRRERYALTCDCVRAFQPTREGFIEVACARCHVNKTVTTPRGCATAMCRSCRGGGVPVAA